MCVLRIAGRRRRATEPSLDKRSRMAAAPSEGTEITDESLTEAHEEGRGKQTRSRQVRPGGHTAVPPGGRLPGSGADIPEGQSAASGAAKAEHVRDRLLGHWGTCPGINLIYAHLNRLILDTGAERGQATFCVDAGTTVGWKNGDRRGRAWQRSSLFSLLRRSSLHPAGGYFFASISLARPSRSAANSSGSRAPKVTGAASSSCS